MNLVKKLLNQRNSKVSKQSGAIYLFVGLGNPGKEYERTRHNIGFMVVDKIIDHHGFSASKLKFNAILSEGKIGDSKVIALKPQTFMNRSGSAVAQAVKFYKIPLNKVIVFHDELDLNPGKIRVKTGGGAGGHNGLKDIDSHIGKDYMRVRIGIGHPGDRDKVSGYVLNKFSKDEESLIEKVISSITDNSSLLIDNNKDLFASKVAEKIS